MSIIIDLTINRPTVAHVADLREPTDSFSDYLTFYAEDAQQQLQRHLIDKYQTRARGETDTIPSASSTGPAKPISADVLRRALRAAGVHMSIIHIEPFHGQAIPTGADIAENTRNHQIIEDAVSELSHAGKLQFRNVAPVLAVLEGKHAFYVIQPHIRVTVQEMVIFSPDLIANNYTKSLFVIYQLLKGLHDLHSQGLHHGSLNSSKVLLTKQLWTLITSVVSSPSQDSSAGNAPLPSSLMHQHALLTKPSSHAKGSLLFNLINDWFVMIAGILLRD